ncbi:hypothetical protein [Streptomyces indicus]|uniref:Lipoprotein n=1 Tax=Streptomyces indicus TaxID=417292 RepID=A0A1G8V0N6_9ACTN|nr:hypothetical protein [Streptomyces indicus]SDJ59662.1 hypothetical protein SAMN05421806_1011184 [Streptomyces indicus]
MPRTLRGALARPFVALARLLVVLGLLACAAGCAQTRARPLTPDDTVRAAQLLLTDRCLRAQGLAPPRPGQPPPSKAEQRRVVTALFGAGRAELRVELPNGYVVRRHTDGCLAAAQQRLYGDQPRWFAVSTTVDNLKSKAPQPDRAAYAVLREKALANARAVLNSARTKGTSP